MELNQSFPKAEIIWVSDSLHDLIIVFQHYHFAVCPHLTLVDIFEKDSRTSCQLLMQPLVLHDFPQFTKHDVIRFIQ